MNPTQRQELNTLIEKIYAEFKQLIDKLTAMSKESYEGKDDRTLNLIRGTLNEMRSEIRQLENKLEQANFRRLLGFNDGWDTLEK